MTMTNNRPFISLIIPVYNEEKYIRSCIESLINQTYPKHLMEWLFIDGKSSDQTVNIISEYAKKYQIKILTNTKRTTPISLNLGVKKSQGKYIIRIDTRMKFNADFDPNSKIMTMNNAMSCCQLSWMYAANNTVNPDSSNLTTPDYRL